jgi:hypothetical protein
LIPDPYLHGGGLNIFKKGGALSGHADFNFSGTHPYREQHCHHHPSSSSPTIIHHHRLKGNSNCTAG